MGPILRTQTNEETPQTQQSRQMGLDSVLPGYQPGSIAGVADCVGLKGDLNDSITVRQFCGTSALHQTEN